MNLSCHKMMASGAGDTLTITCFTCGMPSSKEWAQKISSRPTIPPRPFYPFLVTIQPPAGAVLKEDGTTFVCAFCHASLEAQWRNYERQPGTVPPANRKYSLLKFICAVCGVETYRKRVRTLPFQEFPFLAQQRPPGSLTLGNNPLAVVCLDCSETLWAQSAEYDRWGLPVHKRRFNWLARPPPDPDSLEATVARLPSGETQLPRCPPTEPVLKPKEPVLYEPIPPPMKVKARNSKSESNNSVGSADNEMMLARKTSLALLDQAGGHPPVVTVAPMSSHSASLTAVQRKESLSSMPAGYGSSLSCGIAPPPPLGHPLFPRPTVFPGSSYGPYSWTGIDSTADHYSYSSMDGLQSSSNATWPWIPPPPQSSGLIPYSNYMPTSYSGRSYSMSEPFSTTSSHPSYYPPSPEGSNTNMSTTVTSSSSTSAYLTPLPLQRSSSPGGSLPRRSVPSTMPPALTKTQLSVVTNERDISPPPVVPRKLSAPDLRGSSAVKRPAQDAPLKKIVANKNGKSPPVELPLIRNLPKKSFSASYSEAAATSPVVKSAPSVPVITEPPTATATTTTFKPKANAIRNHMNEKQMLAKKWKKAAAAETTVIASRDSVNNNNNNVYPALSPEQEECRGPPSKILRLRSYSESEPVDFSVKERSISMSSLSSLPMDAADQDDSLMPRASDDVIDLSFSSSQKAAACSNNESSKRFMIAYLCQSDKPESDTLPESRRPSTGVVVEKVNPPGFSPVEPSGRRSVIVTLPKPDHLAVGGVLASNEVRSDNNSYEETVSSHECVPDADTEMSAVVEDPRSSMTTTAAELESPRGDDKDEIEVKPAVHEIPAVNGSQRDSLSISVVNESGDIRGGERSDKKNDGLEDSAEGDQVDQSTKLEAEKIKYYVQQVVGEYKKEIKQAKLLKKKIEADQEEFLGNFGLVTLQKKSEVELNKLISRSNHLTLPPLKLRPATPSDELRYDQELVDKILQIAFNDPSLTNCDLNDEEVAFLAQLGLKPATKADKENRETRWRFMLMERMTRVKRGEALIGSKKPWDSEAVISKLLAASSKCPPEASDSGTARDAATAEVSASGQPKIDSSGTVSDHLPKAMEGREDFGASEAPEGAADKVHRPTMLMQPVISYPKYIPSYVQNSGSKKAAPVVEPAVVDPERSAVRSGAVNGNLSHATVDDNLRGGNGPVGDSRILKVPVVVSTTAGPLVDSSKVNVTDEETKVKTESIQKSDASVETRELPRTSSSCLDEIIRVDALNCENFVNQINNLLATAPASPSSRDKQSESSQQGNGSWPSSAAEWKKLKKYLKSRQSQIKLLEDALKKREKKILSHLRASASDTQ